MLTIMGLARDPNKKICQKLEKEYAAGSRCMCGDYTQSKYRGFISGCKPLVSDSNLDKD